MRKPILTLLAVSLLLATFSLACSVSVGPPPPPPAAGHVRMVNTNALNLRSCPSPDCQALAVLSYGQNVTVYEYLPSGFARVRVIHSGLEGWLHYRYLTP